MASTSAPREETSVAGRRLAASATNLCSDYKALMMEMRKGIGLMKGLAVDLEKEHQSDMATQLGAAVLELLEKSNDCAHYASAIEAVSHGYQPQGDQLTDFKRLLEAEFDKDRRNFNAAPQSDPLYRQFKEAIWNVHHAGLPMPGEEQEELVMTSTQSNILNTKCPITGKPIFDLKNPVRCMDCKHVYEKDPVMHYIKSKKPHPQCPVAGCPKILQAARVICDPMLPIEIEEARPTGVETMDSQAVEDFSEGDDN